ncbi:MAG TPA: SURF1 family protein [Steroidobacteraceae bacterium]|nr:SURF1 family protein [Steroidobacteraceae bacterium]
MSPRARAVLAAALTLVLCAACLRLGVWQWQRWRASALEWERFARATDVLQPLGARTLEEVALYQRVSVAGRLDGAHQFLIDNRSYRGRPGYEVLTPLTRADGRVLLVDRGWVAFTGSRARLPEVGLDTPATVTLSGRAAQLPSAGLASGRAAPRPADPWPKVTSFPRPSELAQALGVPLGARILLLDADAPFGLVRDWQPPGMSPLRHLAYAIQWWCFAALALIVWAVPGLKRVARRD